MPKDGAKPLESYLDQSSDLVNSLVLCLPLLLVYQLGLLYTGGTTLNGVDFITLLLAKQWGLNGLLVFNALLFVFGLVAVFKLMRDRRLNPRIVVPVAIESTFYALLMGTVIILIMRQVPGLLPGVIGLETSGGGRSYGVLERILLSLGAGFHEELVFRLGMFTGIAWALSKVVGRVPAVIAAVLVSSLLFSLAHYLGQEQLALVSFVYRFLAGALFCLLFSTRGFAVAVYTHTIYDIYVLVGRQLL